MSNDITSRISADYEADLRKRLDIRSAAIEECAALCDAAALHYANLQSEHKAKRQPKESRDFESMRIAAVGLGLEIRRAAKLHASEFLATPPRAFDVTAATYWAGVAGEEFSRAETLKEALKPFAELADKHHSGFDDDAYALKLVTVGQLRRARDATQV